MSNFNQHPSKLTSTNRPFKGHHYDHIKKTVSKELATTSLHRAYALGATALKTESWYENGEQDALKAANLKARKAQNEADALFAKLKDVYAFAEPLLKARLQQAFGVEVDVKSTCLRLYFPRQTPWYVIDTQLGHASRTVSLLDAALHNFATSETFTADSDFISKPDANGHFDIVPVRTKMSIEQFKNLCRELDIGGQYNRYLRAFLLTKEPVSQALLELRATAAQKAALEVAAHLALKKKDISADAFDVVLGMIEGRTGLTLDGKVMQCCELSILDASLTGVVLFTAAKESRGIDKLIAYVPHDPEHPLKEYASGLAFLQELTRQLRDNKTIPSTRTNYWQFFSQFIDQQQRGHFFAGLEQRLSVVKWHEKDRLDPGPSWRAIPVDKPNHLEFRVTPIGRDLWQHLYQRKINKLINDAQDIAVSTARTDQAARWAWWDNFTKMLSDIFNAALLVATPFVPGLGELMLAYTAYQLATEVVEGVVDLAEGQFVELAEHVVGVVTDVIQLAAFGAGVAIGSEFRLKLSPLVEGMKPVTLPDGKTTLWHPDLKPYEQTGVTLPDASQPDALGLYRHLDQHMLALEGKVYAIEKPAATDADTTHRIKHPNRPNAYSPKLDHNGHGAWVHEGENPADWQGETLMRRLGHSVERFTPIEHEQIRISSGTDDNQLRRMHIDHAPPPPLLADTLLRFSALDEVRIASANLRGGRPLAPESVWFEPLLTELPGWPTARALKVYEGADLSGQSRAYGNAQATAANTLSVGLPELLSGRFAERVMAFLSETEISSLLGRDVPRAERAQALRNKLADVVDRRRGDISRFIYQAGQRSDKADVQVLRQTFTDLPLTLAEKVLAQATPNELRRIVDEKRLPLRLKTLAREVDFEVLTTRAYDGFYHEALLSPDTERLALNTMRFFSDSFGDLRMEVRSGNHDGPLRCSVGPDDASTVRLLIRDERGRYEVLDDNNRPLHPAGDFYEAILHALPVEKRAQLGYQTGQGRLLELWIMERSAPPAQRRVVLAQPPIRSVASVETNDLVRTPWWFFGTRTPEQRVQELYPKLSDRQVTSFVENLRVKGDPDKAIDRLKSDLEQLRNTLQAWRNNQPVQFDDNGEQIFGVNGVFLRTGGSHIERRLLECFERKSKAFGERSVHPAGGYTLDLSSETLGPDLERWWKELRELPDIRKFLNQITTLNLNNARYSTRAGGLLSDLPNLRQLSARDGSLTLIPPVIGDLHQLRVLDLADNRIVMSPHSRELLGHLTRLETLRLDGNPLRQPPDVSAMPGLKVLRLANTGIEDWPPGLFTAGAAVQNRPRHFLLDMRRCPINSLPQVTSGSDQAFVLARSRFSTTRLSDPDRARFGDYRESVGFARQQVYVEAVVDELAHWKISSTDTSFFSPSESYRAQREESWHDVLAEHGAFEFFKVIRRQRDSQDYQNLRSRRQLTHRVWQMVEAMAVDSDLREELFMQAGEPETCADAGSQLFNRMGMKVLVSQAYMESTSASQLENNLVRLARSAARLDMVGDIARAEISHQQQQHLINPAGNNAPDDVEVHMAFETGLAKKMDLPWRSEDMLSETRSGVDQAKIETAWKTIIERERGDGLVNGMIDLFEHPFWEEYLRKTYPDQFETNDRLYATKHAQLETLRETQKEWAHHQDREQTNQIFKKLEDLAKALNIPEQDVFTGEEMTPWFYKRQITDMAYARNWLARELTHAALTRAGL
ncbi:dermonecrotic toxin domain-containing protein [Pseudomonas putida]|uniref:dermonecrotic toxin domain-containing protein n=1 Tax=Pseudomonas putida TaxID=303 RepID=UPI003D956CCD